MSELSPLESLVGGSTISIDTAKTTMYQAITSTSKYAGYWTIGGDNGLRIFRDKKPRWLVRKACSLVFDFIWVDDLSMDNVQVAYKRV
jgi:hypothetical protein